MKLSITPTELTQLIEESADATRGTIIDLGMNQIEIVCEECRGDGTIETGEFDDHVLTKCPLCTGENY